MLKACNVNKDQKKKRKKKEGGNEGGKGDMKGNREERLHARVYYRHDIQQHKNNTLQRVPLVGQNLFFTAKHGKD